MPSEIRMPQLGMNQDSAIIVSWLKTAGEKVAAGEPIFEVETDKATVEVEAAADGYLAGIRAQEGTDVPVGDVIALIVATEEEVAEHAAAEPAPVAAEPATPMPEPETEPESETHGPAPTARPVAAPPTGKVLASPKAKRLAAERGINLAALRAQGVPEPIHAAALSQAGGGGQSSLFARSDGAALDALLGRSEGADRTMLLAAFVAGAWRAVFGAENVAVAVRALDGSATLHANPDRGGAGEAEAASIALVDLCDTRLSGYAPAGGGVTLSVATDGTGYLLTLSFGEGALAMPHAVALLDDIAARVEDPIRQLL